ncbi:MAG: cytochrome c biogenesis protein [bacterium]
MKKSLLFDLLLLAVVGAWIGWLIVGVPPAQDAAGGWAQKIFYIHVPSATIGFFGFMLVAVFSLGVLMGDARYWDARVVPAVEVSFLFASFVLLTGPFWAKPVWGIWWRWEPRMTTFFMMWLMYAGWFLLRRTLPVGQQQRIYSAIYAMLAFLNVPVVMLSVYFWKPEEQLHPQQIQLTSTMRATLYVSFAVVLVLFLRFLWFRTSLELLSRKIEEDFR